MNTMQLGELIKILRKKQHMTQEELAENLNVSISAVSKWETGKNLPDIDILHQLSILFHVSIDDLYHAEDTLLKSSYPNDKKETKLPIHKKLFQFLIILGIVSLLIFSIIGICTLLNGKSAESSNLYPFTSRITEDSHFGTVYEVAYISNDPPEDISGTSPFITQLSDDWEANTSISADISVMKLSFYADEKFASNWSPPLNSIYIIR